MCPVLALNSECCYLDTSLLVHSPEFSIASFRLYLTILNTEQVTRPSIKVISALQNTCMSMVCLQLKGMLILLTKTIYCDVSIKAEQQKRTHRCLMASSLDGSSMRICTPIFILALLRLKSRQAIFAPTTFFVIATQHTVTNCWQSMPTNAKWVLLEHGKINVLQSILIQAFETRDYPSLLTVRLKVTLNKSYKTGPVLSFQM